MKDFYRNRIEVLHHLHDRLRTQLSVQDWQILKSLDEEIRALILDAMAEPQSFEKAPSNIASRYKSLIQAILADYQCLIKLCAESRDKARQSLMKYSDQRKADQAYRTTYSLH